MQVSLLCRGPAGNPADSRACSGASFAANYRALEVTLENCSTRDESGDHVGLRSGGGIGERYAMPVDLGGEPQTTQYFAAICSQLGRNLIRSWQASAPARMCISEFLHHSLMVADDGPRSPPGRGSTYVSGLFRRRLESGSTRRAPGRIGRLCLELPKIARGGRFQFVSSPLSGALIPASWRGLIRR